MASNQTPENYNDLVALATDAADGAHTHGAVIGLKQNTEPAIRTDLTSLTGAEADATLKRSAKAAASAAHQTADSNAKAAISRFILMEKPRIGSDWGPLWQEAGFTGGSIRAPRTVDDRFVLLGKIGTFLHNHPECAITDAARPDLDLTEAVFTTLHDALSTARAGLNQASSESAAATAARESALDTLRRRLSGLRDELARLPLPGDSPLWYAFGFNRPDDPATPGVPDQLTLAAGAPGSGLLIADWARARRATGYRVKIQVPGEPEPRVFGLFADDQATLTALPTGVLLSVTITAHNASGDGPDSAPATITLP